mmetsp:Transcript_6656/g.9211  ORF Transcript_6656/g.9211 Transcript_6656/m.9211 type:complete len:235 (+) Transcript_6656:91-795(+)
MSSSSTTTKSKKTRILLVRHGSTTLTVEDRFAGSTDVELGPEGEFQANALAQRIKDTHIAAVYSSPMKRTMKTASILAAPHNLEINTMDGLKEIDHGHWEQKTRAEVEKEFPEEYAAWDADPFTYAPQGGETGLQVLTRALPCIREIVANHSGKTVLVVSHKATIRLLIGSFLGFDLRRYRDNLDQLPCCLNILDFTTHVPLQARLVLFNDISHYITCNIAEMPTPPRLSKAWQ